MCLWLSQTVCFKFRWQITSHMKHANIGGEVCWLMPVFHMTVYICDSNCWLLSYKIKNKTHHGDWTSSFNYFFSVYCFEEKTHTTLSYKDIQLKIPCFASSTIICLVLLKSPIDKTPNISFNAEFQFGFFVHGFLLCESPKIHILSKNEISQFLNLLLSHVKRWM